MSQEEKRPATRKAPRTKIEDLPRPLEELSEEEAALAAGGYREQETLYMDATRVANTCTAGNALQGSDTDSGTD